MQRSVKKRKRKTAASRKAAHEVDAQLSADVIFRSFNRGESHSLHSLEGIFNLMVKHNFEYPNFYQQVYGLTKPRICYSIHRKKFFDLLDVFLSSTHLPAYLVAAFIKRLSRMLLWSPVECQEPLLSTIRNLLVRHPGTQCLVHRDEPIDIADDPYRDDVENPKDSCALESSLWEIKSMQEHWFLDVIKRANFVDKPVPHMESFVRWSSVDDIFKQQITKHLNVDRRKSDEDEVGNTSKEETDRRHRGGAPRRKKDEKQQQSHSVPIAFRPPKRLFDKTTTQFDFSQHWSA